MKKESTRTLFSFILDKTRLLLLFVSFEYELYVCAELRLFQNVD